ncbi:hypothetical protein CYMTET_17661, partial [Cymbomonas tetramitiformis]
LRYGVSLAWSALIGLGLTLLEVPTSVLVVVLAAMLLPVPPVVAQYAISSTGNVALAAQHRPACIWQGGGGDEHAYHGYGVRTGWAALASVALSWLVISPLVAAAQLPHTFAVPGVAALSSVVVIAGSVVLSQWLSPMRMRYTGGMPPEAPAVLPLKPGQPPGGEGAAEVNPGIASASLVTGNRKSVRAKRRHCKEWWRPAQYALPVRSHKRLLASATILENTPPGCHGSQVRSERRVRVPAAETIQRSWNAAARVPMGQVRVRWGIAPL